MKRGIRFLGLFLAFTLVFAGAADARIFRPSRTTVQVENITLSAEQLAAFQALKARIEAGEPINGCKNAKLARASTQKAPSSANFTLAAMPSEICTETAATTSYYTNPFSWRHPILITSSDPALTITNAVSSNPTVASIYTSVDGSDTYYYLQGNAVGTVTLTVTASNGKSVSKKVTVKKKVYISSFSFYTGQSDDGPFTPATSLTFSLATDTAVTKFNLVAASNPTSASMGGYSYSPPNPATPWPAAVFSSSNPQVAKVSTLVLYSNSNAVQVLKPGAATITVKATDGGKAKGSFRLTVAGQKVTTLELGAPITIQPGTRRVISPVVGPSNAFDLSLTWSSSNKKVSTIDNQGVLTAVAPGTARITCLNKASGKSDSVSVLVSYDVTAASLADRTTYRIYGLNLTGHTMNFENTLNLLKDTYARALSADNVHVSTTSYSAVGALSMMNAIPGDGVDANDVTIVYFGGFAKYDGNSTYDGSIQCSKDHSILTVAAVQSALETIPGTVVVIVDAEFSGAYIADKGTDAKGATIAQQKAFGKAWTSAFATSKATNYTAKALNDSSLKSKFKILTASSSTETVWPSMRGDYTWFGFWLMNGLGMLFDDSAEPVGFAAIPPANLNPSKDEVVTLCEIYKYIQANMRKESSSKYWQTVCVWPENDPTAIFNRNAPTT